MFQIKSLRTSPFLLTSQSRFSNNFKSSYISNYFREFSFGRIMEEKQVKKEEKQVEKKPGLQKKNTKQKENSPEPFYSYSSYVGSKLNEDEERAYKAGGVLPIFLNEVTKEPEILLGIERRIDRDKTIAQEICICGGKRESSDKDSKYTAAREFYEETGELIPIDKIYHEITSNKVIWLPKSKYVLCLWITNDKTVYDIPSTYSTLTNKPPHCEMDDLYWFKLNEFLEKCFEEKSISFRNKEVHIAPFIRGIFKDKSCFGYMKTFLKESTSKELTEALNRTQEQKRALAQSKSIKEPSKSNEQSISIKEPSKSNPQSKSIKGPSKLNAQSKSIKGPSKLNAQSKSIKGPSKSNEQSKSIKGPYKSNEKSKSIKEPSKSNEQSKSIEEPKSNEK